MRLATYLVAAVLGATIWVSSAVASKPATRSYPTICEYFGGKPQELKIRITTWSDLAKFTPKKNFGKKEVETIRKHFSEYVIINEDEREWLSHHVSLLASGPREGTVEFPPIRDEEMGPIKWCDANFLTLHVGTPARCDSKPLKILAPRAWVDLLPKEISK